jgi:hypothetical protein
MATKKLTLAIAALIASQAFDDTSVNLDGERIPPDGGGYSNGMANPVNGFVDVERAEERRAQALTSGDPTMTNWALHVLPQKFALLPAISEFSLTGNDKFCVESNCAFAQLFITHGRSWCPQAFIATPPTGPRRWDQGPTLPGYGSFDPSFDTIQKVNDQIDSAFNAAVAQAEQIAGGAITFGPKVI